MADWTTPKTWAIDEVVGASDLNTHVRDNLNFLPCKALANPSPIQAQADEMMVQAP